MIALAARARALRLPAVPVVTALSVLVAMLALPDVLVADASEVAVGALGAPALTGPASEDAGLSGASSGSAPAASDTIPDKPYYGIPLRRPGEPFGRPLGYATVAFPETPFNVAVTERGVYIYDLRIAAAGLRPRSGVLHVLWLASPDLTHLERVGVLNGDEPLGIRVAFDNKFLLFVTEEASADVERPTGRVVLRGISRAGRMESMFSHEL